MTRALPRPPGRILPLVLAAAGLLAAAPAQAQNEPVRFYNRASQAATALYVMRAGQSAWSANLLNRGPLAPAQFHAVRLGEGAGCRFDVRLVLQDGTEILRPGADVCATRSVDLAPGVAPAPAAQPPGAAPAQSP